MACVGDERCFSFVPSRQGDTLSDKVALNILNYEIVKYKKYTYLDRAVMKGSTVVLELIYLLQQFVVANIMNIQNTILLRMIYLW